MSWNMHSGADWLGRRRLQEVADAIAAASPDVVALQEVDRSWGRRSGRTDQPAWLADALGMEVLYAPHASLTPRGGAVDAREVGVALLTRLPVAARHVHQLGTLARRVPWPVRLPSLPEFVLDVAGTAVSAFSVHLDVVNPAQRVREARELVQVMRAHRRPVVLLGDLNSDNFGAPIGVLKSEGGFLDACGAVGHRVRSFPTPLPRRRLDHVLVRGLLPVRAAVWQSRASDHLPVVAELDVPDGAP